MGNLGIVDFKMSNSGKKSKPALGFLTILRHEQHGLFGGYLILNPLGRPLEFHCTAPIKPNRAQEILYGPTLDAFLYGEQIGQTLLKQAGVEPMLVCTDQEPTLTVREHTDLPVVLVMSERESMCEPIASEKKFRLDGPHRGGPHLLTFELGRNRLALPSRLEEDRRKIMTSLAGIAENLDLAEPFDRIRDAIEEAQQAIRG
jgi:hypothetical protein